MEDRAEFLEPVIRRQTMLKRWFLLGLLILSILAAGLPVHGQPCPTVCVIIPEWVIINRFLGYGFHVVDQTQIKAIRLSDPELVKRAFDGDSAAIMSLSDQFAADILVIGEAFAEVEEQLGRLALQPTRARVEVRAIETATGRILAAEALHTGGIDLTLNAAGKKALQRAGEEIAYQLAKPIAQHLPAGCGNVPPPPPKLPGGGDAVREPKWRTLGRHSKCANDYGGNVLI
jgi:hypothetical protein